MARHWRDETGEIEKIAVKLIKENEEFTDLLQIKFLYCWRDEPRYDDEDRIIAAQVKVLSAQWRDLTTCDVMIEVCEEIWQQLSVRWRRRLVEHELRHVLMELEDDGSVKTDKQGRLKLGIRPHDIVIRTFQAEIDKWGMSEEEVQHIRFLLSRYKQVKAGKLERYSTPEILLKVKGDKDEEAAPTASLEEVA